MDRNKKVWGILAIAIAFLYLIYTPMQSKFAMHIGELDLRFGLLDICISLTNKLHIIGFGILSVFLLHCFKGEESKYLKTFFGVLSFSFFVEITQIFFVDGHFRLRDLVTNAVGILISFVLFGLVYGRNNTLKTKKVVSTVLIALIQVVAAMILYTVFKEISVSIGGEELRKYL